MMFRGELWVLVAENGKVEGVTDGDAVTFTAGQGHRVAYVVEVVRCGECRLGSPLCGLIRCNKPHDAEPAHPTDWYCADGRLK